MNGKDYAGKQDCNWTEDEEALWHTDCGEIFQCGDGTPYSNDMRFCCFCGAVLKEVKWGDEE